MSALVPLPAVADINPPTGVSLRDRDLVSFLPMAAVEADGTTSSGEDRDFESVRKGYTAFLSGDILVAKITPCFENGKIAQAKISRSVGFGSTEFHVVRAKAQKAHPRFLLHFLRQKNIRLAGERRMTGSAGQRRVPEAFICGLTIPLPPLIEQKRIAEILDRAEALRTKRRAGLAQLDTLTQSIFLDLFGTLTGKGWTTSTMAEIALPSENSIRTGPFGSQLLHSEFVTEGIAVLGIDNAVHNEFRWDQRRFITENKYRQLKRYTVHPGDVLITIMGTCGRCAVVPSDIPRAINTKHLCCITPDPAKCLPLFLHAYFLRHPVAQTYLSQTAKGAIMSGLNMGLIKQMPIVVPPIMIQHEFTRRAAAVEKLKAAHRQSLQELDSLFASLQFRAFRGEL